MRTSAFASLLTLICCSFLAGCVSIQDRFDKAAAFEAEGRYAEAAQSYITVLRRDAGFSRARDPLARVGALAVERYLGAGQVHAESGDHERALGSYRSLDALRGDAAEVGVTLAVPEGYADLRDRTETRAEAEALDRIGDVMARGDYAEALRLADAAERDYRLGPDDLGYLVGVRAEALEARARAEFEMGRFRAAFGLAEDALAFTSDSRDAERLRAFQGDAVRLGTRIVAFTPVRYGRVEGAEPSRTAEEMNAAEVLDEVLLYDFWTAPPLFIAPEEPRAVREGLRDLRLREAPIAPRDAALLGRALGADFVVTAEFIRLDLTETDLRGETRTAPYRGRGRAGVASYRHESFRLHARAEVAVRLVDPATREVLRAFTVEAREAVPGQRARYEGDPNDLDLSREEARLFEPTLQLDTLDELADRLVEELAPEIGERTFATLLRYVE